MEVPVEKVVYVDKLKPTQQIPRCEKPLADSLAIEDLLQLIPRLSTAIDKCNVGIDSHNKQSKEE